MSRIITWSIVSCASRFHHQFSKAYRFRSRNNRSIYNRLRFAIISAAKGGGRGDGKPIAEAGEWWSRWPMPGYELHPTLVIAPKTTYRSNRLSESAPQRSDYPQRVLSVISKHNCELRARGSDIYNFDETASVMGIITAGMAVTTPDRRIRPRQAHQGNRETGYGYPRYRYWWFYLATIYHRSWQDPSIILV